MKESISKLSLILNIVLIAAVALLYVDRFSGEKKQKGNTNDNKQANETDKALSSGEIVFVNMDSLVSGYDLYNVLSLELMEKQKSFETQLNSKLLSYQNRTAKLQSDYEKHLITSANYQKKAEAMMMEQQQISMWREEKSMELMEDEQNLTLRIFDSIVNVVNEYNADNKHKLIVNNSYGGVLLFGDKNLNITDTILSSLNSKVNQDELLATPNDTDNAE